MQELRYEDFAKLRELLSRVDGLGRTASRLPADAEAFDAWWAVVQPDAAAARRWVERAADPIAFTSGLQDSPTASRSAA